MAAPYSLDLRRKVLQACDDDTIRKQGLQVIFAKLDNYSAAVHRGTP